MNNNLDQLENVIKHELTHFNDNIKKHNWIDLLPEYYTDDNQLIKQYQNQLIILFLKFNLTYEEMYYLTSGKEFESYCTLIEENKHSLNIELIKSNIFQIINDNNFLTNVKPTIQRLYIFILLNKIFDKSNKRFEYILQHLK